MPTQSPFVLLQREFGLLDLMILALLGSHKEEWHKPRSPRPPKIPISWENLDLIFGACF